MVPQRIWNPWDPEFTAFFSCRSFGVPFYILGPEAFYEGAPLGVAIAADKLDIADEAMSLVKVEWEQLPFVIDYNKALEAGAPRAYEYLTSYNPQTLFPYRIGMGGLYGSEDITIRTDTGWEDASNASNILHITDFSMPEADMDQGFTDAEQTIEFTFHRTENIGFGPEILSTVAHWNDNGNVDVYQAGEHEPSAEMYSVLTGIHADKFQVHDPYAGGQFGGWDSGSCPQTSQIPVAVFLAKKANKPVKLLFQRKDEQYAQMDEGTFNIKVGFKNDGTITAIQMNNTVAQCADASFIPETCGGGHFYESTKIANFEGTTTVTMLNKHGFGAVRCEQQIDAKIKQQVFTRVDAALGVDEGTIQTVNDGQEGKDHSWVIEFQKQNKLPVIDSLDAVLPKAKELAGWEDKFHAPGAKKLANGKYHGMCMGANHEFSNGGPPDPNAYMGSKVNLTVDKGKIYMVASRPDCGLDGRTGYSRIIAEETGMKLEDVKYDRMWEGNPSQPNTVLSGGGGSVVFTVQSWPILALARTLKLKMLNMAAAVLGIDVSDLDIVDSMVVQKSNPSNATAVEAIPALERITALWADVDFSKINMPEGPSTGTLISRCVNIVEVEVDPETGSVDVVNAVAVNDVGQPIGPETVEGQMYGAAIMGYSTNAIEEVVYDASTGTRLNPNFLDYKIMTMLDAPEMQYEMVTSRMGYGTYGACGIGEDNCTFGSAMITPAVYNAIGKWVDTYPPTPERVLKALGKA
jgi:CO/xanthine dehydrogenase Mo-binding subunit